MLGYVKPDKPELKIKEYEIYRGFYCSLCKALGKKYSFASRLFLSYDVTFFLIFLYALKPDVKPEFKKGRCPFNPFKKCNYINVNTEEFDFAVAFSVIMTYYKIKDNIRDSRFYKKAAYIMLLPFISIKHRKAKKLFPEIEDIVKQSINEQIILEKEECDICDKAAHPSATALAKCFCIYADKDNENLFYRFGYCLGRYVYLIDAFDDIEKDRKNKSYNVFIINGYTNDQIVQAIRMSINELILCLDFFDFNDSTLVSNIIRNGLDKQLCLILRKKEGTANE